MKRFSLARIWTPRLYDLVAGQYDRFFKLLFPMAEEGYRRVLDGLDSGSIMDAACGTGTLLAMAQARGMHCYGIDNSPAMLDRARAKVPQGEFALASFYDIPYLDGSFDYVVETNAVSGVRIDARQVLSEMIRVCKPGGEVRIGDWGKPATETWKNRLLVELGILIGDFPHDYVLLFRDLGYEPAVEVLGADGIYQFVSVRKASH
jgi:ubiquinone/menaquinone biosynthesis C-methylase UbiE